MLTTLRHAPLMAMESPREGLWLLFTESVLL
jgi:hypothetical protein